MTNVNLQSFLSRLPEENSRMVFGFKPMLSWILTQDKNDPIVAVLTGAEAYNNLLHDEYFIKSVDPSSKLEAIKAGILGTVCAIPFMTDAYMHPDGRRIPKDAFILFTATEARFYHFQPTIYPQGERKVYCTDPGHRYQLADGQELRFIKKEKDQATGEFKTIYTGTTNEELLEVLIDRTNFVNGVVHSAENDVALYHLKAALTMFNKRTAARTLQNVEATPEAHKSAQEVIDQANALMEMASWHKDAVPKEPMGDPVGEAPSPSQLRAMAAPAEAPIAKFPFPE